MFQLTDNHLFHLWFWFLLFIDESIRKGFTKASLWCSQKNGNTRCVSSVVKKRLYKMQDQIDHSSASNVNDVRSVAITGSKK